nr:OmpA family protein [Hyphomonas sp. Mor2]
MHSTRGSVIAIVLGAGIAACAPSDDANFAKAAQCVDVPDGQYFQFVDGKLVQVQIADDDTRQRQAIAVQIITQSLHNQGFPWLTVDWDGQTAVIGGLAPNRDSEIDGFRNAQAAFNGDPVIRGFVREVKNNIDVRVRSDNVSATLNDAFELMGVGWLQAEVKSQVLILTGTAPDLESKRDAYRTALNAVNIRLNDDDTEFVAVDAIAVDGQASPVGSALLGLEDMPSMIACDNAFFDTMNGRSIAFVEGQSVIDTSSNALMDALSGIAHLCRDYEIEIRQHAAGPSETIDVQELSQNRASRIRDRLSIFGDRDAIMPRGMGAEYPLDDGNSPEAQTRNQRTEFTVRDRAD